MFKLALPLSLLSLVTAAPLLLSRSGECGLSPKQADAAFIQGFHAAVYLRTLGEDMASRPTDDADILKLHMSLCLRLKGPELRLAGCPPTSGSSDAQSFDDDDGRDGGPIHNSGAELPGHLPYDFAKGGVSEVGNKQSNSENQGSQNVDSASNDNPSSTGEDRPDNVRNGFHTFTAAGGDSNDHHDSIRPISNGNKEDGEHSDPNAYVHQDGHENDRNGEASAEATTNHHDQNASNPPSSAPLDLHDHDASLGASTNPSANNTPIIPVVGQSSNSSEDSSIPRPLNADSGSTSAPSGEQHDSANRNPYVDVTTPDHSSSGNDEGSAGVSSTPDDSNNEMPSDDDHSGHHGKTFNLASGNVIAPNVAVGGDNDQSDSASGSQQNGSGDEVNILSKNVVSPAVKVGPIGLRF